MLCVKKPTGEVGLGYAKLTLMIIPGNAVIFAVSLVICFT